LTEKDTASWLTIFKEVAAAVLGGIIIVLTLVLMWPLLSKATPDLTSAQGIFAILGGWGGIIIGYYFGRLPSEKAADTANKVANTANKVAIEANQASTTAKQTADDAVQTKLRVVSDCTNLLENTAKSLKN
jgi:hypothetical protein